jgi:hypothetical protein
MGKKEDIIYLISAAIFHADQALSIYNELTYSSDLMRHQELKLHLERYTKFARQLSEDISNLRKAGEIN